MLEISNSKVDDFGEDYHVVKTFDEAFFSMFFIDQKPGVNFFYFSDKPSDTLIEFSKNFRIIKAAGGIVRNKKNELLAIRRNGIWDLPKGKIESGEKIEEAAIREVEEECGISDLLIDEYFDTTFHVYPLKNKINAFKPTYWFAMATSFEGSLIPQLEEGITETKFLSKQEEIEVKEITYPSLKSLFSHKSE